MCSRPWGGRRGRSVRRMAGPTWEMQEVLQHVGRTLAVLHNPGGTNLQHLGDFRGAAVPVPPRQDPPALLGTLLGDPIRGPY
eukprot:gene24315-biopygen10429